MLRSLDIRNYLLVREATLQFQSGLTVVTGETGAGKSIIVGAIDVLLGEKFPKDAIGPHADKAIIEGTFRVAERSAIETAIPDLEWNGAHNELLIRREIGAAGRTRSFVNDLPVTVEIIQTLRARLADFHGQREQHSLFQAARQLDYLDALLGLREKVARIKQQCESRRELERERKQLSGTLEQLRRDRALLTYQLEEIERLGLKAGEEEIIEARLRKLESAEKLTGECAHLVEILSESEPSLLTLAGQAKTTAATIAKVDPEFGNISNEIADLVARLKDIAHEAQHYLERLNVDENDLAKLRERRTILWDLRRKHGVNVEQILSRADEMKQMLKHGEELEQREREIAGHVATLDSELLEQARELSRQRHQGCDDFARRIVEELRPLGFAAPHIELHLETKAEPLTGAMVGDSGIDRLDILFSANPGLKPAPLSAVASGGETSRLTLAVKSVLADKIEYPLLVYDEIDAGISGKTADAIGRAISKLSRQHQVLVITHLPQIAAQADHQLAVSKAANGRTSETTAKFLSQHERVDEIAALIAGVNITDKSRASASELLKASGKIKAEL
jgi:DNA repair protein RecN (Recombination protein N)